MTTFFRVPAAAFLAIGASAIADGFLLQMRKPCAWHINLAVMAVIAVTGLTVYAVEGSQTCLVIAVLMAMTIVSWMMGITKGVFRDADRRMNGKRPAGRQGLR